MFWNYYYGNGEKSDPIVSYVLLGVMALLLVAIGIYNHKQDKKKRGRL